MQGDQPNPVSLSIHHVPQSSSALVKIQPPRNPLAEDFRHVPCDVVLVIDISGSMRAQAPIPGEQGGENTGLSVLDLVKHSAYTIIETMNEQDRLGVVVFASQSRVLQELTNMTEGNKKDVKDKIKAVQPQDATNLWHGILDGLKLFTSTGDVPAAKGRAPAVMVLTDGMPNHGCPNSYVPAIRRKFPLPASIHTFGFGYSLRSGLLKSIAEVGGGNYAFIPDAGMVGTVFVHALANLQATFATSAVLEVECDDSIELITPKIDSAADVDSESVPESKTVTIPLGNLQYAQSRDIVLRIKTVEGTKLDGEPTVRAMVKFTRTFDSFYHTEGQVISPEAVSNSTVVKPTNVELERNSSLQVEVAFHESRTRLMEFLSFFFPLDSFREHKSRNNFNGRDAKAEIEALLKDLPASAYPHDTNCKALLEDIIGSEQNGQIYLALTDHSNWTRWGQHFLPSLLNAHSRQICNSFKDPGPLRYSIQSPLFIKCRDALDEAFDNLPPPEPSAQPPPHDWWGPRGRHVPSSSAHMPSMRVEVNSMASYRDVSGVCFDGSTLVTVSSGGKITLRRLRRGMRVRTPVGFRRVRAILKTWVVREPMVRLPGRVVVTPWHPLSGDAKQWRFPGEMEIASKGRYTGHIYSVILEKDMDTRAHAMRVGAGAGYWGVTLGHGITKAPEPLVGAAEPAPTDVRAHKFFGNYAKIMKGLQALGIPKDGVVKSHGVVRGKRTGQVCRFKIPGNKRVPAPIPPRSR